MNKVGINIVVLSVVIAVIATDLMRLSNARREVNSHLDVLVQEAIIIDRKLREAKSVYVGDILSEEEMFLFMTDGRISVIESPGTKFEVRSNQFEFENPPPNPSEIEPVVIVRAWANDRFGIAIVHRGEEVYRGHSLYDAARWFNQSEL